jgi:CRISPR-associated protein (TIGR02584 family)
MATSNPTQPAKPQGENGILEHLLLVSLGTSPGVVFALLLLLAKRQPAPTHLWIVTTDEQGILANLQQNILIPLSESFPGLQTRVFVARGIDDVRSDNDHRRMSEILYRLVLRASDWRRGAANGRRFSIGFAGGRKTMVATLQDAATFFFVDSVYHVVNSSNQQSQPRLLSEVVAALSEHHLIAMREQPSAWFGVINGVWEYRFPQCPLASSSFQLDDDLNEEKVLHKVAAVGEDSLFLRLHEAAGPAAVFASPQAMAASVGQQFLHHDLRDLLAGLQNEEIVAIRNYLAGLRQLLYHRQLPSDAVLRWADFPNICRTSFILAIGRVEATFNASETLHVVLSDTMPRRVTPGFTDGLLIVILRNLLANIRRHGKSPEEWDEPTAHITVNVQENQVLLEVSNELPKGRRAALTGHDAAEVVALPHLLEPLRSEGPNANEGIGLFTIAEVARNFPAATLDPPQIHGNRFLIRFRFTITPEAS